MATAKKATPLKPPARKAPVGKKSAPQASAKSGKTRAVPARTQPAAALAKSTEKPAADSAFKPEKPRKPKLVRDSFTIPKAEYLVLEALKQRAAKAGVPVKKSELLRAGIKTLAGLGDGALMTALGAVPTIKTGRPAKA